jgi:hypothetical protein
MAQDNTTQRLTFYSQAKVLLQEHDSPLQYLSTPHYPKTLPAVAAVLLSLVSTFLSPLPNWISPSSPPIFGIPPALGAAGIGGGGGPPGGGGGPPDGGGGAPILGIGGGGGGPLVAGDEIAGLSPLGLLLSIEDNGRGGAMAPNRIDASSFAPPRGPSSSSSEEESESPADQSSSSGRGCLPVG